MLEKIRVFRQNMRKRAKRQSSNEDDEFTFRRENVFDFDAWYRAHFQGDFTEKIRNERVSKNAQEYQQQMDRIARGESIQPPRLFKRRNEPASDIEIQMAEMQIREFRKDTAQVFMFVGLCIVSFFIIAYIIEINTDKSPWVDPYVIKREREKKEEEEKKKSLS